MKFLGFTLQHWLIPRTKVDMEAQGNQLGVPMADVRTLDKLVVNFGGCGSFQVCLVLATYTTQICALWGLFFMVFGNYHGDWSCAEPARVSQNGRSETILSRLSPTNIPVPFNTSFNQFQPSVDQPRVTLNNSGHYRRSMAPPDPSYRPGGFDADSKNTNVSSATCGEIRKCSEIKYDGDSSTIVTEFNLICDKEWIQSFTISIQMAGVLLGSWVGGFIGDHFGRRISLYGNLIIHAMLNFVIIFSVSWQMFVTLRFLIGLCIGGILTSYFTYPMEFVGEWWRGVLGAIPVWNAGAATFALTVLLLKDWRHIHIATAALSLLFFLPVIWIPESLRWLAIHGKTEKAKKVVEKIAKMNDRPPPRTIVLDIVTKAEKNRAKQKRISHTFCDLFVDPFIRKVSFVMGFVWGCLGLIYYTLSFGVKALSGDFYTNFIIFSVAELPGMLFVAPASNKLGRRFSGALYFICIAAACLSVVIVHFQAPQDIKGNAITILAMLAKIHILAVWMIVTLFCSELYPTVIRNISSGYLNGCARLGAIAAPYLIPNRPEMLYISFLVMGLLCIICSCLLLLLKETKGRPLDDVIGMKSKLSVIFEETEEELSEDLQEYEEKV